MNQITGEIEVLWSFDTWIALNETAPYLEQYISQILPERLVLIANVDANDLHELPSAVTAMQQRFGGACVVQVDFRDSWAAISQNMKTVVEQCNSYSDTAGYVDSSVQYSLTAAASGDTTPPAGTFRINSGAAATSSNLVTLDFSGVTDSQSGLASGGKLCLSNDGKTWSPMLDFAASEKWPLERGSGNKTVYAQVRDRAGNWTTSPLTASIVLQEQSPLRSGPAGSDFYYAPQFCFANGTIVALSDSGTASMSTDLGSDWSKPQSVLPSPDDDGWNQISLNCDGAGHIFTTGYTLENGNLRIETNSSSDGGLTWEFSPPTGNIAIPESDEGYYYPSLVCASSPSNPVLFWVATIGNTDEAFAIASHDGGVTWPATPVQLTNSASGAYIDGLQASCNSSAVVAAIGASDNVIVYRSVNGGDAFGGGTQIASGAYDFSLVSDPNGGLLMLSPAYGPNSGYSLVAERSLDGGATWTLPAAVAENLAFYEGFQAVSPAPGQFYVAWVTQNAADYSNGLQFASSNDAGATWSNAATITIPAYFYTFMLAEKPSINSFSLAANAAGDVGLLWVDSRQGLVDGYAVQRWGVADPARGPHEDQAADGLNSPIPSITDVYVATSTDRGATWSTSGPIEASPANGEGYVDSIGLWLAADGTGIGIWGSENSNIDLRFLNGLTIPLADPGGPVNDASKVANALAPGEWAGINGQNLASAAASGQPPALPSILAGSSVLITDATGVTALASLYSVTANQIQFVVPDSLTAGDAQMKISTARGSLNLPVSIASKSPGYLFRNSRWHRCGRRVDRSELC